ncbi:holin [Halobacillus shinanisalinarum]|uniref:Holin n=2 Tax=Halobacillus shinanisalinarum TaxID=2932258 RepID=A0ABY4H5M9_9BACI|nr:holin [Halobacillus shinanisalinarum]UOQ95772.1 holin [Halobacillus shinanisalinarum]
MQQVLLFATVISPFVFGVVEVVKKAFRLPKNYIPLISMGIGLLAGVAAFPFTDMGTMLRIWAGVGAGLSGTGLFEIVNKRLGYSKSDKNEE